MVLDRNVYWEETNFHKIKIIRASQKAEAALFRTRGLFSNSVQHRPQVRYIDTGFFTGIFSFFRKLHGSPTKSPTLPPGASAERAFLSLISHARGAKSQLRPLNRLAVYDRRFAMRSSSRARKKRQPPGLPPFFLSLLRLIGEAKTPHDTAAARIVASAPFLARAVAEIATRKRYSLSGLGGGERRERGGTRGNRTVGESTREYGTEDTRKRSRFSSVNPRPRAKAVVKAGQKVKRPSALPTAEQDVRFG